MEKSKKTISLAKAFTVKKLLFNTYDETENMIKDKIRVLKSVDGEAVISEEDLKKMIDKHEVDQYIGESLRCLCFLRELRFAIFEANLSTGAREVMNNIECLKNELQFHKNILSWFENRSKSVEKEWDAHKSNPVTKSLGDYVTNEYVHLSEVYSDPNIIRLMIKDIEANIRRHENKLGEINGQPSIVLNEELADYLERKGLI